MWSHHQFQLSNCRVVVTNSITVTAGQRSTGRFVFHGAFVLGSFVDGISKLS
jgi:hypothetical protein